MGVPDGLSDSGRDQLAFDAQLALGAGIDESTSPGIPLCRFPDLSRKFKYLAPLRRRDPPHWLVKPRRNIELDNPCHSHPPLCFLSTTRREATQMPKL